MAVPRPLRALAVPVLIGVVVTASAGSWRTITIGRGDTLSAIAKRYHTSVAALVALNKLPGNGNLIYAGASLRVPVPAPKPAPTTFYVVRSGDTASAIAARTHTTVAWLASHNRLGPRFTVYRGKRLVVPGRTAPSRSTNGANTFAGRSYADAVVASANRHRAWLASHRQPSRTTVRSMIVTTARRYSVDPALALAVSWQEAGFQQRVVSPADAIGVMQVIPSTGDYVSRYVVHRRLNLLKTQDNVTAGVALLSMLVRSAHLDTAIAGYYQGLGSVRRHGMYADTVAYVSNVRTLRARFATS